MGSEYEERERGPVRGLWVEEPARRYRMPDPVRDAAVRAVLIVAVTLIQASVTFFLTLTASWLAFPMVLGSVAGVIVATWGVLDVWITRQMWRQRHGVVSAPSSTARPGRRDGREDPAAGGEGYGPPGVPYARRPYDGTRPGPGTGAVAPPGRQPGGLRRV
ncbi:hypothetical protein [Streptomyces sp. NPDC012888]|uniref:hypothetical protein n=1 Tax=Streptomyces sp. NPDC012888 TaxID=3364855 RepID=UPI0036C36E45